MRHQPCCTPHGEQDVGDDPRDVEPGRVEVRTHASPLPITFGIVVIRRGSKSSLMSPHLYSACSPQRSQRWVSKFHPYSTQNGQRPELPLVEVAGFEPASGLLACSAPGIELHPLVPKSSLMIVGQRERAWCGHLPARILMAPTSLPRRRCDGDGILATFTAVVTQAVLAVDALHGVPSGVAYSPHSGSCQVIV